MTNVNSWWIKFTFIIEKRNLPSTIVVFTPHVPVFFKTLYLIHDFNTANYPPTLKTLNSKIKIVSI